MPKTKLLIIRARPPSRATSTIYKQLRGDQRKRDVDWVRAATWIGPVRIETASVDQVGSPKWDIDKRKVKRFAKEMKAGGSSKPIVLVSVPRSTKLVCIDGHHHLLAAIKLGTSVVAYVAVVGSVKGPWETIHRNQKKGKTSTGSEFDK